jgi:predicted O-methyltransferase YrrM
VAGVIRALRRERLIRGVRRERLTYLEREALTDLWERVSEAERRGLAGTLLEAGCALGGSALVMAGAKRPERSLLVYDVFGMIPPPTGADGREVQERYERIAAGESEGIGGDRYYGYEENLLERVRATFARFGMPVERHRVELVRGLYEDTLQPEQPIALAHMDCDWYESVLVCLERIVPWLEPGGVLIIDDYHAWSGARKAVDEFFSGRENEFDLHAARLQIVKRAPQLAEVGA